MASGDHSPRQHPKHLHVDDKVVASTEIQDQLTTVPDGGWGWVVVLAAFVVNVIFGGIVYTFGVFLPPLVVHFDAGRAAIGGIGSLMAGLNWTVGPLASVINNRFGCRTAAILGTVMASLGFMISAFASNVALLYFTFGVVAGVGVGIAYLPSIVAVNMYFDRRRGLATGLVVCGAGIGTITFAPLVAYLLHLYSWRGAILLEAALLLNCCACAMVYIRVSVRSPQLRRREPSPTVTSSKEEADIASCLLENLANMKNSKQSLSSQSHNSITKDSRSNSEMPISNELRTENAIGNVSHHVVVDDVLTQAACNRVPLNKGDIYSEYFCEVCTSLAQNEVLLISSANENRHSADVPLGNLECKLTEKDNNQFEKQKIDKEEKLTGCSQQLDKTRSSAGYFDFTLFKDPLFLLFITSGLLSSVSYCAPYAYLPDVAQVQAGLDENHSTLLISVIGVFNTVARVVFGFIVDFACVNRLVLCCTVLIVGGLTNMCVIYCNGFWLLATYATIYGLCIGTYTCLVSVVLVDLFGVHRLSNAFGINLFCVGVGSILGTPFAGWLFDVTRSYNAAFLFTGFTMTGSGIVLVVLLVLQRCKRHRYPTQNQTAAKSL